MKQSFGKTLMSCFLAVTLMASVLAGAISVTCSPAKADSPESYGTGYFQELAAEARLSCPANGLVYFDALVAYGYEHFDECFIVIMHDLNTTSWYFALYEFSSGSTAVKWGFYQTNYARWAALNSSNQSQSFRCRYSINWTSNYAYMLASPATINYGVGTQYTYGQSSQMYYAPSPLNTNVSGRLVYANQDMIAWNGNAMVPSWVINLQNGYAPPQYVEFDLVKFKLGERTYLTTRDQNIIFNTQPLDDDYLWWYVGFMQEDGSEYTDLVLEYRDLTLIPGAAAWLNVGLTNIHSQGVLAYDITDLLTWHDIWASEFVWVSENPDHEDPSQWTPYAIAVNVPFLLGEDPNGQPDSYTQAWDQFNTYVNTYNTTHVIPEQLSDWLFDTDGAKLFPVTVQVPHAIWLDLYNSSDAPDNHVWRWGGLLAEEKGFQYSLFDTVIVGMSITGYTIRYFYSDTLDPMYSPIEEMTLANVLSSFDVVIIVPDSDGYLNSVTQGYGFTGETGVVYVPDSAELVGNNWTGFAIVTEKAIAKQQLWNFNEGISKLYQLEVDYIDSEDKWKDSFLLWSASMFDMLNSIDGRLYSILNSITSLSSLVDQIRTTLNDIAADPDPDEVKPWYLSLWLFMKQFEPSNAQISEGLGYLVDNIDDIPLLPALTPVPALPTPGGG